MRKPGMIPLTRPAPLGVLPPEPNAIESEYGVLVAADEPLIWLRLNERGSDSVFEAHNVGFATVNGAPVRSGVGQGFTFDGIDDSVVMGCDQLGNRPPRLLNDAGVFSCDLLFKSDYVASSGSTRIARWGSYGLEVNAYKFAGSDNSGYVNFVFYDEAGVTHAVEAYSATIFTPGVQSHLAATFDGEDFKLFVDGALETTEPYSGIASYFGFTTDDSNGIGIATNATFGGGFFKGSVAEFALYDTVLSEARVLEHAEATRNGTLYTAETVSPWPTPTGLGGASSFYLYWDKDDELSGDPSITTLYTRATCKLSLPGTPTAEEVYFWALQVNFFDVAGEQLAGAHGGLQWAPGYPSSKAVCWGGYSDIALAELTGTTSSLPSTLSNPNVRDYEWATNTEYLIDLYKVTGDYWRMQINGTTVSDLLVPDAVYLGTPIIFSEVFADCYDSSVSSRWSELTMYDASANKYLFPVVTTGFQTVDACPNTDSTLDGNHFVMTTNTERVKGVSSLDSRGNRTTPGLYLNASWPDPGDLIADEITWDWKISYVPTPVDSTHGIMIEFEFLNGAGDPIDGYFTCKLFWNPLMSVHKTIRIDAYVHDTILDSYVELAISSPLDLVLSENDLDYFDFPWGVATYACSIAKTGPGAWSLTIDGDEVASFTDSRLEHIAFQDMYIDHKANCGKNRFTVGVGSITAIDALSAELMLEEIPANLDDEPCPNNDVFLQGNEFFTVDTVATRTLADGGEILTII